MGLLGICFIPEVCAAEKLTRKQKKEISLLNNAKVNFDNKQYDIAIDFYTNAIMVNPENPESYAKRGNSRFLMGNYKEAVVDYT